MVLMPKVDKFAQLNLNWESSTDPGNHSNHVHPFVDKLLQRFTDLVRLSKIGRVSCALTPLGLSRRITAALLTSTPWSIPLILPYFTMSRFVWFDPEWWIGFLIFLFLMIAVIAEFGGRVLHAARAHGPRKADETDLGGFHPPSLNSRNQFSRQTSIQNNLILFNPNVSPLSAGKVQWMF